MKSVGQLRGTVHRSLLHNRPLFLTGFMGSGKSTVGRYLANLLDVPFVDLDAEVVAGAGRSIKQIFDEEGEPAFRAMETEVLQRVCSRGEAVIATGGGIVISPDNRDVMHRTGVIVNLMVSCDQILRRLANAGDRPLYPGSNEGERVRMLMEQRAAFYADADIRIDTSMKSVEDVSADIIMYLKGLSP